MSRANAAEAKLSEERKRFQRLREDAKRKLEEEVVGYFAMLYSIQSLNSLWRISSNLALLSWCVWWEKTGCLKERRNTIGCSARVGITENVHHLA